MPFDLLIRDGIVDGRRVNVAVEDGVIVDIGDVTGAAVELIDAEGLHVLPGAIDVHVHFNDPGRADWEGAETGSAALAAGGGTCFFDMPLNSTPPVIDGRRFYEKLAAIDGHSYADFGLWGGIVPGNLAEMDELAACGVVGFKAFMSNSGIEDFGRADDLTLLRGMERAARLGLPVAVHAESEQLTAALTAEARSAGHTGVRDYLASRPIIAEVEAIRRAICFARETGCSLHVVHVSSAAGVAEVADAAKTQAVTCETCAHYLELTADDVDRMGAKAKCAPPLRPADEVQKLWGRLGDGIDLVSSDHSPAPMSMKTSDDFFKVWGGVAGVQSTRGVLLSRLSVDQVCRLTSEVPAERFGISGKGKVAVGFDADLSLVDVESSYTLRSEDLLDRHKLSPYVGRTFKGVVRRTMLRGATMVRDGKVVGRPIGRLVKPRGAS